MPHLNATPKNNCVTKLQQTTMEPRIYPTRIPHNDNDTKNDMSQQLMALQLTMLQMTDSMTETWLASKDLITSVDNLSTTDMQHIPGAVSHVFKNVDTAFTMITQLHDHIEMANNRVINLTDSATENVTHDTPTTMDTRKWPYINSNHSQETCLAKMKQDTFLTTDKLAARALTLAVQTAIGSDNFGRLVLVHDIVQAEIITDTLSLQQNDTLKDILYIDNNELLNLETAYQAASSHNPYYMANSILTVKNTTINPNVRVTPHSTAVKVGLKQMWSMLPDNIIQSAAAMHRILMTAIQDITDKWNEESHQVTSIQVMAFVAGTIMHETISYQNGTIFGGAAYREPMDKDDKNANLQYSHSSDNDNDNDEWTYQHPITQAF
jgi:hypothetical protein